MKKLKRTDYLKTALLVSIGIAALTACSHGPSIQEFPDTASPTDEVAKLEADISSANAEQVNILSPKNFKSAAESLQDSKKSLEKQRDANDAKKTLHSVAEGRAWLNRAQEFAKLSHENIEAVIVARQEAIAANASNLLASDFREADEDFRDVTLDIEKNELKSAVKNRTALQLKYLDLELRAIKLTHLTQARDTIALAKKEGAKEFAPRSLAEAEKSVADTDSYITANRHATVDLGLRGKETRKTADHLLMITRNSKSGKKTSSEEMALRMEREQQQVIAKQGQIDDKNSQLNDKNTQLVAKQNQLNNKDSAIQELSAEKSGLQDEQAFNRRFEAARAEFTPNEAEVYKQGNTLVIRLRGLEFPAAQAVLKGSNFPLLAKVQKVIQSFGKGSVTVEGHTDSNGGKTLNEKLSSDRAEAVKEYFVSNNQDGAALEIKAIGYDYQKPLATNKTASGRAQNRRVDVLIQSETL